MDALYPRLLVRDFAAAADFYTAALRELFTVEPVKVIPEASPHRTPPRPDGTLLELQSY